MAPLWLSIYHAAAMFWETLWALIFGFTVSGVLQVFVSKEQMARWFGRTTFGSMALATGLGAASSSCSYAAAAAARSAIKQGAAFVPALAFMFASTNLVVELGAILWVLMGPIFVLAEVVGALLLVLLVWVFARFLLPKPIQDEARRHLETAAEEGAACHHDHGHHGGHSHHDHAEHSEHTGHDHTHHHHEAGNDWMVRFRAVADAFVMDWSMLWKEMAVGFLIAGFLATLVPEDWWRTLFLQGGPYWLQSIENIIVGPLIAVASFVCSIGNIPLASLLWSSGISFGGVVSFIYADLIVVPLLLIYRKYYGVRAAWRISIVLFLSMISAGLVVDIAFNLLHLVPEGPRPPNAIAMATFSWNYTTWLNLAAIALAGWLVYLHRRRENSR